jgi:Flp pilus assembly protein TadB
MTSRGQGDNGTERKVAWPGVAWRLGAATVVVLGSGGICMVNLYAGGALVTVVSVVACVTALDSLKDLTGESPSRESSLRRLTRSGASKRAAKNPPRRLALSPRSSASFVSTHSDPKNKSGMEIPVGSLIATMVLVAVIVLMVFVRSSVPIIAASSGVAAALLTALMFVGRPIGKSLR